MQQREENSQCQRVLSSKGDIQSERSLELCFCSKKSEQVRPEGLASIWNNLCVYFRKLEIMTQNCPVLFHIPIFSLELWKWLRSSESPDPTWNQPASSRMALSGWPATASCHLQLVKTSTLFVVQKNTIHKLTNTMTISRTYISSF